MTEIVRSKDIKEINDFSQYGIDVTILENTETTLVLSFTNVVCHFYDLIELCKKLAYNKKLNIEGRTLAASTNLNKEDVTVIKFIKQDVSQQIKN